MKIDAAHVQEWIALHNAFTVDSSVSAEFERYLNRLPWAPSRVDWREIAYREFEMGDTWEDKVEAFADRTPLGNHSHVLLMYNGSEPALVALKGDGLRDVDLIYSAAPAARYFCGADLIDGNLVPTFEDFAEFDGIATLTFRI